MSATTNSKMTGSHVVKTTGDDGQNVVGAQIGRDVTHNVVNNYYYSVAAPDHAAGAPATAEATDHRGSPSRGLESHSKPLVIFVGAPGTGTSALANSVIGKPVFHAAYSDSFQLYTDCPEVDFCQFMLDDNLKRYNAGEEIKAGLSARGRVKIIFVVRLDDGRLRPYHCNTINIVMKVLNLNRDQVSDHFAILINMLTSRAYTRLQSFVEANKLKEQFTHGLGYSTTHIGFNSSANVQEVLDDEMFESERMQMMPVSRDVLNMIQRLPYIVKQD